jgi:hypothetical protein
MIQWSMKVSKMQSFEEPSVGEALCEEGID